MDTRISKVINEVSKVVKGKDDIIAQILMAVFAKGHILLDDVPGVGKTTMAVAVGKALGMKYNRIQFTPDVLPSDIVGFSIYNKANASLEYVKGAVSDTNILLGDEINRTSSKTQSALLEAMEERQVTVDSKTYPLENPFIVIATQNNVGSAGTQLLPYAQLDRFLVRLTLGYPDFETQMEIIKDRQVSDPMACVNQVMTTDDVLYIQEQVSCVEVGIDVLRYITALCFATREDENIEVGVSPRGAIAVNNMAKARAFVMGRDYVIPEDVAEVFDIVCAHRIILSQKARFSRKDASSVLCDVIKKVEAPNTIK